MLKNKVRSFLSILLSIIPHFKGKGRVTLFFDRILTDYTDPHSYNVVGSINGGYKILLDMRSFKSRFCYYYRECEYNDINMIKQLYDGGIFLDVGSCIGLYVICMSDLVNNSNGSIIAVEPVPLNIERLESNIRLNKIESLVSIVPYALGSEDGIVRMSTDETIANNALISEQGNLSVKIKRLDDLALNENWGRVSFIKVDIEGFEPKFVEGAQLTIERDRPVIFGEFNTYRMNINGFSMDSTWNFLVNKLQYNCYFLSNNKLQKLEAPENMENLYFIPNEMILSKNIK